MCLWFAFCIQNLRRFLSSLQLCVKACQLIDGAGTWPWGAGRLAQTHTILLRETIRLLLPAHSTYNPSMHCSLTRARGGGGRRKETVNKNKEKWSPSANQCWRHKKLIHSTDPSSQGCWQEMYNPLWMPVTKRTFSTFVSVNGHNATWAIHMNVPITTSHSCMGVDDLL